MTIVTIEALLLCPCRISVGPAYRVEARRVGSVPKMDADGLVRAIARNGGLPWNWAVVIRGV